MLDLRAGEITGEVRYIFPALKEPDEPTEIVLRKLDSEQHKVVFIYLFLKEVNVPSWDLLDFNWSYCYLHHILEHLISFDHLVEIQRLSQIWNTLGKCDKGIPGHLIP